MRAEAVAALREIVHGDPVLARRLADVPDAALLDAVTELARELSIAVTADELRAATADARSEWVQRWLR